MYKTKIIYYKNMGTCISKKNNYPYSSELIDNSETSNDKIYFIIEGRLHINNEKNYYTKIYFYEDYLYIKNNRINEEISYYKIKSWSFDEKKKLWKFYEIKKEEQLYSYEIYLYPDKHQTCKNVSEKLKKLINDHINFKNSLINKLN